MPTRSSPEKSILVVDDDASIRRLLERMLDNMGWEATCVSTAHEAMDAFHERDWSLVLSDVDLGNGSKNGIALAKELREKAPALRIIIMSGEGASKTLAEEAGFREFIHKPEGIESLPQLLGE